VTQYAAGSGSLVVPLAPRPTAPVPRRCAAAVPLSLLAFPGAAVSVFVSARRPLSPAKYCWATRRDSNLLWWRRLELPGRHCRS